MSNEEKIEATGQEILTDGVKEALQEVADAEVEILRQTETQKAAIKAGFSEAEKAKREEGSALKVEQDVAELEQLRVKEEQQAAIKTEFSDAEKTKQEEGIALKAEADILDLENLRLQKEEEGVIKDEAVEGDRTRRQQELEESNQTQTLITQKVKEEFGKRGSIAAAFVSASSSFAGSLVTIEQNKLDRIKDKNSKAYKDQKAKLVEAAKLEKGLSISQAFINAAGAIIKTMANVGLPWSVPLVAAQTAAGAAQIAAIASTPIPSAAMGADFITAGPQLIMVGDNPSGVERVTVTPAEKEEASGPNFYIDTINVTANNPQELADQISMIAGQMGGRAFSRA